MRSHPDKSIYGTNRVDIVCITGFIVSLVTMLVLLLTIIPEMEWLNWLNVPLAVIGLALCLIGVITSTSRGYGVAGAIICCVAIALGLLRLNAFGVIV